MKPDTKLCRINPAEAGLRENDPTYYSGTVRNSSPRVYVQPHCFWEVIEYAKVYKMRQWTDMTIKGARLIAISPDIS